MNGLVAAALADFRERIRSFRFIVVLMATIYLSVLMVPAPDAGYLIMDVNNARGVYDSAWIGFVFGAVAALMLPLFGFFVIKDAVQRDRVSGVGVLLAATPIGRVSYVAAKFLSNVGILAAIVALSSLIAVLMQLWRGEDYRIDVYQLLFHHWLVAAPVLLSVAALGVLFECVPGLRGAFGNAVFFFAWMALLIAGLSRIDDGAANRVHRYADFFGVSAPFADFDRLVRERHPGIKLALALGAHATESKAEIIPWPGISGDHAWVAERLLWTLAALPLLLIAAFAFDRFDPARNYRRANDNPSSAPIADVAASAQVWHRLTGLSNTTNSWQPMALIAAELRLMLERCPWWWYAGCVGFWIAGVATPTPAAVQWVVPLAWLWALSHWSQHGARAQLYATESLLASAPAPILRQLPAQWLAALLLGVILVAPVLLKLLFSAELGTALQVCVGAGFVAALTLACGALSRGPRLFEIAFLMLWYANMQHVPGSAFSGNSERAFVDSQSVEYVAVGLVLLLLTAVLRQFALRR